MNADGYSEDGESGDNMYNPLLDSFYHRFEPVKYADVKITSFNKEAENGDYGHFNDFETSGEFVNLMNHPSPDKSSSNRHQ